MKDENALKLSDFALFLSVMKNKKAYQNTLSIILDEPDIIIKDSRILELDGVVREVRESEEWEAVRMNIYEQGIQKGIDSGENKKLIQMVSKKKAQGRVVSEIAEMLEEDSVLIQKIYDALDEYDGEKEWDKILNLICT